MRKRIYYIAGVICLAVSGFMFAGTNFSQAVLTNNLISQKTDSSYKDHYHIGFAMPKNSLRQGSVYMPIYSNHDEQCLQHMAASFGMFGASITENHDYFEAQYGDKTLRLYRYIDYLEYKNIAEYDDTEQISDETALNLALNFLEKSLPHPLIKPYDTKIKHSDDHITVQFVEYLSNIPNRAFPTEVVLDVYGNVISAGHFFFDYEILGAADIITARTALTELPKIVENKVHLTGYQLVYDFEDSVLMPVYRFWGHTSCGTDFEWDINALRFY